MKTYPFLIAGEPHQSTKTQEVINPFNGQIVGSVYLAQKSDTEKAIQRAVEAFEKSRHLPSHERARILKAIADALLKRREELARMIVQENGKPIRDCRMEVDRAVMTFEIAAEEAKRIPGELIPMDLRPDSEGRLGIVKRFPMGPVTAITPFNYPLNLAVHKIAPAFAVGNPVILKPSMDTPITALLLGEIIQSCNVVSGMINVVTSHHEACEALITDERIKMISFTGSPDVGWDLKRRCDHKRITLELGGNAGVIVHEDADLDLAVQRCLRGAFAYAGQVCISVQRIYIHQKIYSEFVKRFLESVKKLKIGDPMDEATDIGPMIKENQAIRAEEWIQEAVKAGAKLLAGGKRKGSFIEPTVLENVPKGTKACDKEAFAPLVDIFSYANFEEAVRSVNDTPYGLQAGIFTRDIGRILHAFEKIEVGGLMVNEVPTFRLDHMPYGGTKSSGFGREGLRYAMEEMTEPRLLILKA
ncbi:MAG: aldehyde dehydrogenase family protein [Chlamydiae bacterium]|nr:aldehyde dehydrogenase family protein [Chlamydiota bacterium]MBI3266770.1 aldehyde dehydrogenase family protein [Chlamydiota bacterium]